MELIQLLCLCINFILLNKFYKCTGGYQRCNLASAAISSAGRPAMIEAIKLLFFHL